MTRLMGRVTRGMELVDQRDGVGDQTEGARDQTGGTRYYNYPTSAITIPKHRFSEFLFGFVRSFDC